MRYSKEQRGGPTEVFKILVVLYFLEPFLRIECMSLVK